MASLLERRSAPQGTATPTWSQVPPLPEGPRHSRAVGLALRAAGAVVVALILWLLGHPLPALILLAVVAVVSVSALAVPRVGAAMERAFAVIEHGAAHVVGLVVLTIVELLVFTPIAVVAWILRFDPIARGSSPKDPTLWQPSPVRNGKPLYRRQFGYERAPATGGRRRSRTARLVTALGVVVVLLAADLAVGAAINGVNSWIQGPKPKTLSVLPLPNVAARRNEPWSQQLANEISYTWDHKQYDPYLGWKMPDFNGRYVHVANRVRRSWEPPGAASSKAVTVYFFGGSTMWGTFQRDDHTIPSEVAKLAQADGITLKVVNYASQAYVNWQETLLLQQLVTGGNKPDVAVFYDGANDLISQSFVGPYTAPTTMEQDVLRDRFNGVGIQQRSLWSQVYDWYGNKSAVIRGYRQLRSYVTSKKPTPLGLVNPWAPDQSAQASTARARDAVDLVSQGDSVAQALARSYGFQTMFIWQPTIYTKGVAPGEENVPGAWGENQDAWKLMSAAAKADLRAPLIDMTGALDGVHQPIMYDFHHTNELGAAVMARAIYAQLRPQLLDLARSKAS